MYLNFSDGSVVNPSSFFKKKLNHKSKNSNEDILRKNTWPRDIYIEFKIPFCSLNHFVMLSSV